MRMLVLPFVYRVTIINSPMPHYRLVFRVHAIRRMVQRRISVTDVEHVLASGDVIEDYPDDTPYPSRLMLAWCNSRPVHVVVTYNRQGGETIIITAYEPDRDRWDADFRRRRTK